MVGFQACVLMPAELGVNRQEECFRTRLQLMPLRCSCHMRACASSAVNLIPIR